jgi:hypothetical protein
MPRKSAGDSSSSRSSRQPGLATSGSRPAWMAGLIGRAQPDLEIVVQPGSVSGPDVEADGEQHDRHQIESSSHTASNGHSTFDTIPPPPGPTRVCEESR